MEKRKTMTVLRFFIFLFWILFCLFPGNSWAQPPTIVSQTPTPDSLGNPINTIIRFQFSSSMDTMSSWIGLRDRYDNEIEGNVFWSNTVHDNDTLTFIPTNALRPAMVYEIEGSAWSVGAISFNIGLWDNYFGTKPSTADTTPPTVETVYPYSGMTGAPVTAEVICVFSKVMNPSTINSTNITLSGPCRGA